MLRLMEGPDFPIESFSRGLCSSVTFNVELFHCANRVHKKTQDGTIRGHSISPMTVSDV